MHPRDETNKPHRSRHSRSVGGDRRLRLRALWGIGPRLVWDRYSLALVTMAPLSSSYDYVGFGGVCREDILLYS